MTVWVDEALLTLRWRLSDENGAGRAKPWLGECVGFCWSGNDGRAEASEMDDRRNEAEGRPRLLGEAASGGSWVEEVVKDEGDGSEMPVIDCEVEWSVWIDGSRWSSGELRSRIGDGKVEVWAVEGAPVDEKAVGESNDEPVDSAGRVGADGGDE